MEIDMMKEPDVMVYLMTGFLDSGKTQFLNFTLSQDYFQIDGKTPVSYTHLTLPTTERV